MIELDLHVTTPDAVPEQEPYRISNEPGHDTVLVDATLTADDVVRALRVVFDSDERKPDPPTRLVANLGAVCGLNVCGGRGVMPLAAASGRTVGLQFRYADTGGVPDGAYPVSVHAVSEAEGWA